jgi:FAD-dependent urate hydroxylase
MRYEQPGYPPIDLANPALRALAEQARGEIAALAYPTRSWVEPRLQTDQDWCDVAIVGSGQSALGLAFGLKRAGIQDTLCLEAAAQGQVGPWLTYARMATLRTPKDLVGLEFGQISLGFRRWYEVQFGEAAWSTLERIARVHWAAYLDWYAEATGAKIRYRTNVDAIRPVAGGFALALTGADGAKTLHARRVVLATGFEGSGGWDVPDHIKRSVPAQAYAHSNGPIAVEQVAGKRVAILGHGASAFDNAAWALANGAARVDLCFRRAHLPEINPHRWAEQAGFLDHFYDLPDAVRWQIGLAFRRMDQPPTASGVAAATAFSNFQAHPGRDWLAVEQHGAELRIATPKGPLAADFLICATGLAVDLARRPELDAVRRHIALWADRYTPPPEQAHAGLAASPYLGPNFEFLEREPGTAPFLEHLFCFSYASNTSHGGQCTSISGHKYALPRLVRGVARSLFLEQTDTLLPSLAAFDEREILLPR